MRLSAHDIRSLTFRKVLRGVDAEEVQAFLETVSEQVAQRDEELAGLRIRMAGLEQELAEFRNMETGLRDTLAVVQNSSTESLELARREGDLILKQAELDAGRITADARERLSALRNEVLSLEDQRTSFVIRLKALVKGQLDLLEVLAAVRPEPVRPEPVLGNFDLARATPAASSGADEPAAHPVQPEAGEGARAVDPGPDVKDDTDTADSGTGTGGEWNQHDRF